MSGKVAADDAVGDICCGFVTSAGSYCYLPFLKGQEAVAWVAHSDLKGHANGDAEATVLKLKQLCNQSGT